LHTLLVCQDPDLREAAQLLQKGLEASKVEQEEAIWTQIIDKYGSMDKPWVPDVVGRAWGNRGNARSRQVCCAALPAQCASNTMLHTMLLCSTMI
jgi:hypothetical protein